MKKNKAKYLHSIQLSNGTRCKTLQSFDNFALRSEFSFEFLTFRCRIIWNCRSTHKHTWVLALSFISLWEPQRLLCSQQVSVVEGKRQRKHYVYAACDRRSQHNFNSLQLQIQALICCRTYAALSLRHLFGTNQD